MRRIMLGLSIAFMGGLLCASAFAGSAVVGSVAGSVNATMGGRELVPNSTIFNGDNLQVKDGVAVVALGHGSRLVFGRESTVSFSREADSVIAVLGQGNVSLFCPDGGGGVRVKVGDVTIMPAKGFRTLGEVAMANGSVMVTAKEGLLRVEGYGQAVDVAKGKTIAVTPKLARGGGGGGGRHWNSLEVVSLGVGITGGALGAWAIHDASNAKDSANASIAAADAATKAAQAAAAAALAAQNATVAAGCALNQVANQIGIASPYTPPTGYPPC